MSSFAGLYTVDVQKAFGSESWTNVYHVDAIDLPTALAHGVAIANIEKTILWNGVAITAVRARPTGVKGAPSAFSAVNIVGTRSILLPTPLQVCVRVDFDNSTSRPGRKYLHCASDGQDCNGILTWKSSLNTSVDANYSGPLMALGYLRDARGRTLQGIKMAAAISYHQMRRGSRRKAQPVITA